jgi:hypothetical protein
MVAGQHVIVIPGNGITGNFIYTEEELDPEGVRLVERHTVYEIPLSLNSRTPNQIEAGLDKLKGIHEVVYPGPANPSYTLIMIADDWPYEYKLRQKLNRIFYKQKRS